MEASTRTARAGPRTSLAEWGLVGVVDNLGGLPLEKFEGDFHSVFRGFMLPSQVARQIDSAVNDVDRDGAKGAADEFFVVRVNVIHCRTAIFLRVTFLVGFHL